MKPSHALLYTLNLTAEQLVALLDEPMYGPPFDRAKREHPRSPYRIGEGIVVEVRAGGAPRDYARVATRDLSASGIGFLHLGALPGGTPVVVHLPGGEIRERAVAGRVVRCFGLTGNLYDVGVAFDNLVNIKPILENAKAMESADISSDG
jgi:hypothetical protein